MSRSRNSRDEYGTSHRSAAAPRSRDKTFRHNRRSLSRSPHEFVDKRRRTFSRSPHLSERNNRGHFDRTNPTQSRVLGIFGLSVHTTEGQIKQIFSKFGPIEYIQVVYDAKTGRSRGFCFVYYSSAEDAKVAKGVACGMEINKQRIRVDYSITQRAHSPTPGVYMGRSTRSERGGGGREGGGGGDRDRGGERERGGGGEPGYRMERRDRDRGERDRRERDRGERDFNSTRFRRRRSPSPQYNNNHMMRRRRS